MEQENATVTTEKKVKKASTATKAEKKAETKAEKKKLRDEKPSPHPLLAVAIVFTVLVIGVYLIANALIANNVF